MKTLQFLTLSLATLTASVWAAKPPALSGDYLEVRTCNVYVGGCVANAEMGVTGKEGILVWSVRQGEWKGTRLDGLKVLAVVSASDTLADQRHKPAGAKAVLIVDAAATTDQASALADMARTLSGKLIAQVVETKFADVKFTADKFAGATCMAVKAGNLVDIETQGLAGHKPLCGNETLYYPPLTDVTGAQAGYTVLAAYQGSGLGRTWESTQLFSAYVGTFSR